MIRTYSESGRADQHDGIRTIALGRAMKDFPDGLPSSNGWDEDTTDSNGVTMVTVTLRVDDDPAAT